MRRFNNMASLCKDSKERKEGVSFSRLSKKYVARKKNPKTGKIISIFQHEDKELVLKKFLEHEFTR